MQAGSAMALPFIFPSYILWFYFVLQNSCFRLLSVTKKPLKLYLKGKKGQKLKFDFFSQRKFDYPDITTNTFHQY